MHHLSWKVATLVPGAARGNAAQRAATAITKHAILPQFRQ